MSPIRIALVALTAWLLAGCAGTPTATKPTAAARPAEPAPVRPVIVVERAQLALVAVLDLLKSGQLRQAEVNLEEIIRVRPDLPEAHFNLGWTRLRLGRFDAAVDALREGLARRPTDAAGHHLHGLALRELGRFGEAEQAYLEALRHDPTHAATYLNLGILYEIFVGKRADALNHYRRYQNLVAIADPKVAGWIALLEREQAR